MKHILRGGGSLFGHVSHFIIHFLLIEIQIVPKKTEL